MCDNEVRICRCAVPRVRATARTMPLPHASTRLPRTMKRQGKGAAGFVTPSCHDTMMPAYDESRTTLCSMTTVPAGSPFTRRPPGWL